MAASPCGAGIFYVRKSLQEKLVPRIYGWHNVRSPDFVAQEKLVFRRTAGVTRPARRTCWGWWGCRRRWNCCWRWAWKTSRPSCCGNAPGSFRRSAEGLDRPPRRRAAPNASGIITFYREGAAPADMAGLFQKLREAGVEMSLRGDRAGRQYLANLGAFLQHGRRIAAGLRIALKRPPAGEESKRGLSQRLGVGPPGLGEAESLARAARLTLRFSSLQERRPWRRLFGLS